MECKNCGRWAPADPETGYDADDFCPRPACQDARTHDEELAAEEAARYAADIDFLDGGPDRRY